MFLKNDLWLCEQSVLSGLTAEKIRMLDSGGGSEKTHISNNFKYEVRDGSALINIIGLIERYDNFFAMMMDATSLERLMTVINIASDDAEVERMIFNFDTPGGSAKGLFEATEIIRNIEKPTVAYVESMCASAGYALAAACDQVISNDIGYVGSVGAIVSVMQPPKNEYSPIVTTYVSALSPNKNLKPGDEHFDAQMQDKVDLLANAFVDDLALSLSLDRDFIIANFGGGDVLVAKQALAVNMITGVGNFESLFNNESNTSRTTTRSDPTMTLDELKAQQPALYNKIVEDIKLSVTQSVTDDLTLKAVETNKDVFKNAFTEGQKAEATRLSEIDAMTLPGHEKLITECKADSSVTAAATAIKIIQAEKMQASNAATKLANDNVTPINAGVSTDTGDWDNNASLRAEFGDDKAAYESYAKAEKKGNFQIFGAAKKA